MNTNGEEAMVRTAEEDRRHKQESITSNQFAGTEPAGRADVKRCDRDAKQMREPSDGKALLLAGCLPEVDEDTFYCVAMSCQQTSTCSGIHAAAHQNGRLT